MLTAETRLKCDGCQMPFNDVGLYVVPVTRHSLEEIRRASHDKGWRQYRLTSMSSIGDFCPQCQKDHRAKGGRKS